jgi:hypothetical protein
MLIIKDLSYHESEVQGKWFDFTIWGAVIPIKIRPRTNATVTAIREQFKDSKDDAKRAESIGDATLDFFVEDFKGIGDPGPDGTGIPWEVNLANKKRLVGLEMRPGERPIFEQIYEKATSLGFEVIEEEQKN